MNYLLHYNAEQVQFEPAAPAAGVNYTSPIGDASKRLLLNIDVEFQASVAVANRLLYVSITPSGFTERVIAMAPAVITAGLRAKVIFTIDAPTVAAVPGGATGVQQMSALPSGIWLNPADQFTLGVVNIQAADQIDPILVTYLRNLILSQ